MKPVDTKTARDLEADAAEYPDERGEILLEAAAAWRRAGDRDRALEILTGLLDDEGHRCDARVELADLQFEDGADEEAYAQLALLAKDPALDDGHCELAAELLAERGDLPRAARWYDRAAARLTDEQLTALRTGDGWVSIATAMTLGGRRQVREQLGLIPDVLDGLVPEVPSARSPITSGAVLGLIKPGADLPGKMRMLTFQRSERAEARRLWPDEYEGSDEEYYPATEANWRQLRDGGVPTIVVVAAKADDLVRFAARTGGSPTDSDVKRQYCQSVPDHATISWPPARNALCWCGAQAKYKKCCGRPTV